MKLVLNNQQKKNLKALNDFYDSPKAKNEKLKAYEWGEKLLSL